MNSDLDQVAWYSTAERHLLDDAKGQSPQKPIELVFLPPSSADKGPETTRSSSYFAGPHRHGDRIFTHKTSIEKPIILNMLKSILSFQVREDK